MYTMYHMHLIIHIQFVFLPLSTIVCSQSRWLEKDVLVLFSIWGRIHNTYMKYRSFIRNQSRASLVNISHGSFLKLPYD